MCMTCTCGRKECICSQDTSPVDLQDAIVSYQILEMKPGFPIAHHFSINLDAEDLRDVEMAAEGQKFRFPVAFAPNLRCIAILRTLFWIEHNGSLQQQRIEVSLPQPAPPSVFDKQRKWKNRRLRENATEVGQPQQIPAVKSRFYKLKFSPCGQYVAMIERQHDNNEFSEGRWNLSIWKNESPGASTHQDSVWERTATLYDIYGDFLHDGNLAFSPQFQMIALLEIKPVTSNQTTLWKFGTSTRGMSMANIPC